MDLEQRESDTGDTVGGSDITRRDAGTAEELVNEERTMAESMIESGTEINHGAKPKLHKCQMCEEAFSIRNDLNEHVDKCHDPFWSNQPTGNNVSMDVPERRNKQVKRAKQRCSLFFHCQYCSEVSNNVEQITEHLQTVHQGQHARELVQESVIVTIKEKHECIFCSKQFQSAFHLQTHCLQKHKKGFKKRRNQETVSSSALTRTTSRHICSSCYLIFPYRGNLVTHRCLHHGKQRSLHSVKKRQNPKPGFQQQRGPFYMTSRLTRQLGCDVLKKNLPNNSSSSTGSASYRRDSKSMTKKLQFKVQRRQRFVHCSLVQNIPKFTCIKRKKTFCYICHICQRRFLKYFEIKSHWLLQHGNNCHHSNQNRRPGAMTLDSSVTFSCGYCEYVSRDGDGISSHIQTLHAAATATKQRKNRSNSSHRFLYPCQHCSFTSSQHSNLKRHVRAFHSDKGNLQINFKEIRILRTPSIEKAIDESGSVGYKCPFCADQCRNLGVLKRHVLLKHKTSKTFPVLTVETANTSIAHISTASENMDITGGVISTSVEEEEEKQICDRTPVSGLKRSARIHERSIFRMREEDMKWSKTQSTSGVSIEQGADSSGCEAMAEGYKGSQSTAVLEGDWSLQGSFRCDHCRRIVSRATSLYAHLQEEHSESVVFYCVHCSKEFTRFQDLKTHLLGSHNDSASESVRIRNVSIFQDSQSRQSSTETEPGLASERKLLSTRISDGHLPCCCDICGALFSWRKSLCRHVKDVHGRSLEFLCGHCEDRKVKFNRFPDMAAHLRCFHNISLLQQTDFTMTTASSWAGKKAAQKIKQGTGEVISRTKQGVQRSKTQQCISCKYCDHSCKLESQMRKHVSEQHAEKAAISEGVVEIGVTVGSGDKQLVSEQSLDAAVTAENALSSLEDIDSVRAATSELIVVQEMTQPVQTETGEAQRSNTGTPLSHDTGAEDVAEEGNKLDESRRSKQSKMSGNDLIDMKRHFDWDKDLKFRCDTDGCGKIFSWRKSLSKHKLEAHGKALVYICEECSREFSSFPALKSHLKRAHVDLQYLALGLAEVTIIRHQASTSADEVLTCTACGETFTDKHSRRVHDCTVLNKKYHCPYCSFLCQDQVTMTTHISSQHKKMGSLSASLSPQPGVDADSEPDGTVSQKPPEVEMRELQARSLASTGENSHGDANCGPSRWICGFCQQSLPNQRLLEMHLNGSSEETSLECPLCNKEFSRTVCLQLHLRLHKGNRPYLCGECGKAYPQLSALKRHQLSHVEGAHRCRFCNKGFIEETDLQRHLRLHTGERPYQCEICGKRYCDQKAVKRHIVLKHTQYPQPSSEEDVKSKTSWMCEVCGLTLNSIQKLQAHIDVEHQGAGLKPDSGAAFHCDRCPAVFRSKRGFEKHVAKEHHSTLLDRVTQGETTPSSATEHIIAAVGKQQWQGGPGVLTSGRPSSTLQNAAGLKHVYKDLREVESTGGSGKVLRCKLCGKTFKKTSYINLHMRRFHTRDEDKPCRCQVCGRGFPLQFELKQHMRVHTNSRPYSCRICKKTFKQVGHIKDHMLVHSKHFIEKCQICDKQFKLRGTLKGHVIQHCKIQPFKCPICEETFKNIGQLIKHCARYSGDNEKRTKTYTCPMCFRMFDSILVLQKHLQCHKMDQPFKCENCSQKFFKYVDLYFHKNKEKHFTEEELATAKFTNPTQFDADSSIKNNLEELEHLQSQYDILTADSVTEDTDFGDQDVAKSRAVSPAQEFDDNSAELLAIAEQLTYMAQTDTGLYQEMGPVEQLYQGGNQCRPEEQTPNLLNIPPMPYSSETVLESSNVWKGQNFVQGQGQSHLLQQGQEQVLVSGQGQIHQEQVLVSGQGQIHQEQVLVSGQGQIHQEQVLVSGQGQMHQEQVLVSGQGHIHQEQVLVSGQGQIHQEQVLVSGQGQTHQEQILVTGQGLMHQAQVLVSDQGQVLDQNTGLDLEQSQIQANASKSSFISFDAHDYSHRLEVETSSADVVDSENRDNNSVYPVQDQVQVQNDQSVLYVDNIEQGDITQSADQQNMQIIDGTSQEFTVQYQDELCNVSTVVDVSAYNDSDQGQILENVNGVAVSIDSAGSFAEDENAVKTITKPLYKSFKWVGEDGSEALVYVQGEGDGVDLGSAEEQLLKLVWDGDDTYVIQTEDVAAESVGAEGPSVENQSLVDNTVSFPDGNQTGYQVQPESVHQSAALDENRDQSATTGIQPKLVLTDKAKTNQQPEVDKSSKPVNYLTKAPSTRQYSGEEEVAKPHECDICLKRFTQKKLLLRHKNIHLDPSRRSYQCQYCEKGFDRPCELERHKRIHTGEKPHKCQECGRGFIQLGHLITHIRLHKNYKPFKCTVCEKCFTTNSQLTKHSMLHSGQKSFACDTCDMSFFNKGALQRHKITHTSREKRAEILSQLNKLASQDSVQPPDRDLGSRVVVSSGEGDSAVKLDSQCDKCGKTFSKPANLKRHMMRHVMEKAMKCDECGRTYATKALLIEHMRIHQDKNTMFPCEFCGKLFQGRRGLGRHVLSVHKNGEAQFKCAKCNRQSKTKTLFTYHLAVCCPELMQDAKLVLCDTQVA